MASSSPSPDPYETLGVREDASIDRIRKAYIGLPINHHPDTFIAKDDAEKAANIKYFQEITKAHELLNDEQKKRNFDEKRPFDRSRSQPKADANQTFSTSTPVRETPPDSHGKTVKRSSPSRSNAANYHDSHGWPADALASSSRSDAADDYDSRGWPTNALASSPRSNAADDYHSYGWPTNAMASSSRSSPADDHELFSWPMDTPASSAQLKTSQYPAQGGVLSENILSHDDEEFYDATNNRYQKKSEAKTKSLRKAESLSTTSQKVSSRTRAQAKKAEKVPKHLAPRTNNNRVRVRGKPFIGDPLSRIVGYLPITDQRIETNVQENNEFYPSFESTPSSDGKAPNYVRSDRDDKLINET